MSLFIKRLSLVLLLIVVLTQLINLLVPDYYGNYQFVQKLKIYEEVKDEVNTVFWGSSNVHRHINPIMFDTYSNGKTHSFNFGTDGTNLSEIYYMLEQFYEKYTARNIIITLNPLRPIFDNNVHTYKNAYYQDYKRVKLEMEYNRKSLQGTDQQQSRLLAAFAENKLAIYKVRNLFKLPQILSSIPDFMVEHRGFHSINNLDGKPRHWSGMQTGGQSIKSHEKEIQASKLSVVPQISQRDSVYLSLAYDIVELVKSKGGTPYFVYQPNNLNYFRYNLPNGIYLGDANDFPEYFNSAFRYYPGIHLNDTGADMYSIRLAGEFQKVLKE